MNRLRLSFLFSILMLSASAVTTFTSTGVTTNFNSTTTWTESGDDDADNVPDSDDNVVISLGHNVRISGSNGNCNNLTVSGTLQFTTNHTLNVYGDYILNGTGSEVGATGILRFRSPGTSLTVTGTTSASLKYYFSNSRTIIAGSTINKASTTIFFFGNTITNFGTFTIGSINTQAGATFINGAGATLNLKSVSFMLGRTFTANAANNTVSIQYTTGGIPNTTGGYYNLTLAGTVSGSKTLGQNTTVANNLTINSNNIFNTNGYAMNIGGNFSNSGTFTAGTQTVTFNGTTTVSGTATTSFYNVTVSGTLTGHATNMNITHNFINNGTFNDNDGTVTFNGTVAQTISGTSATIFENLTINNTAGVSITSGTYELDGVLTLSNGTFSTGGNSFTMNSTAAKTARIAQITGTGAIAGNFTIERWITARTATYADLSSPVQSSTFLDWDNELVLSYTNPYTSAYRYSETADDFISVSSSATALVPGRGFEVYLSENFAYAAFTAKAINTIGVPNQGDQSLSARVSFNNAGTNLVGNPFASNISWNTVLAASSNLSANYDVYDYTAQNYTTYGAGTEIAAGQGFWVYATGAPTFNVPENAKTSTSSSDIKSNLVEPYFTLKLASIDSTFYHTLKIAASNEATDRWDIGKDHPFRKSPMKVAPSIYSLIEGKKAIINIFNSNNQRYSIPLTTTVGMNGNYRIEANGFNFLNNYGYTCIKLEDKILQQMIDLNENEVYEFKMNVNDDPNRFIVHFSKDNNCKSYTVSNTSNFENEIEILASEQGNIINFNLSETTETVISITNILGQKVMEPISVDAYNQSLNISIPDTYTGVYILRVESAKGAITKKFVRN